MEWISFFFYQELVLCFLILIIFVVFTLRKDLFGFTNRIPDFLIGMIYGYYIQTECLSFSRTRWIITLLFFLLGNYLGYLTNFRGFSFVVKSPANSFPSIFLSSSLVIIFPTLIDRLRCLPHLSVIGQSIHRILSFYGSISLELFALQQQIRWKLEPYLKSKPFLFRNFFLLLLQTIAAYFEHCILNLFWTHIPSLIRKVGKALSQHSAVRNFVYHSTG